MSFKLSSAGPANHRVLELPSPAEVCGTSLSKKVRLHYAEDLGAAEWDDQPTRPLRVDVIEGRRHVTEV